MPPRRVGEGLGGALRKQNLEDPQDHGKICQGDFSVLLGYWPQHFHSTPGARVPLLTQDPQPYKAVCGDRGFSTVFSCPCWKDKAATHSHAALCTEKYGRNHLKRWLF